MSKCYHEEKGINVNQLHHAEPDVNCTCDVGGDGPANDPELIAKRKPALQHPQTPDPVGPGADPELLAKSKPALLHPETPAATGPAK